MHNATVNFHKQNSLDASLRIIERIDNSQAKDEIINQAAKEIFTQQKTGYITKEEENVNLSLVEKVISIIKK